MRRSTMLLALAMVSALTVGVLATSAAASDDGGPNKVWLCHFEDDHQATMPYGDDRNGSDLGFYTTTKTSPPTYLDGDYIVKWNPPEVSAADGVPSGLNGGQWDLCTGNYGEFILVSVNAIGSDEDVRGHRAQLVSLNLPTYPDGWKG